MVFNATFNKISVTSWRSVLLVEETEVPRENMKFAKAISNYFENIFGIENTINPADTCILDARFMKKK